MADHAELSRKIYEAKMENDVLWKAVERARARAAESDRELKKLREKYWEFWTDHCEMKRQKEGAHNG